VDLAASRILVAVDLPPQAEQVADLLRCGHVRCPAREVRLTIIRQVGLVPTLPPIGSVADGCPLIQVP
jgi:hypothetical protein